jgi:hypothetical protein
VNRALLASGADAAEAGLPAWLSLSRPRRQEVIAEQVAPLLAGCPRVSTSWVDVEGFSAHGSDVLIARTPSPRVGNHLFEALRDTDLFAVPYVRLERILTGIEDGYRHYERSRPVGAAGGAGATARAGAGVPVETGVPIEAAGAPQQTAAGS